MNTPVAHFSRLNSPSLPRAPAEPREPGKTKILVAEDDALCREVLCRRLGKMGYEVIATKNGTDALAGMLEENAPAVAILDWMMPGMDGPEVCRRLRKVDRSVYLILLTALATRDRVEEGALAGADDHLIKPCDRDQLEACILSGLRAMNRSARGQSGSIAAEPESSK